MALKSETQSPPNGVSIVTYKESGPDEDLEDGEIFDDEESEGEVPNASPPQQPATPTAAKPAAVETKEIKHKKKDTVTAPRVEKRSSPERKLDRDRRSVRPRRKRLRDDEEPEPNRFHPKPNKHRRSRELDKRDDEVDENEMLCMRGGNSPPPSKLNHHHDNHWDRFDSQDEDDDRDGGLGGRERGGRRMGREAFGGAGRIARRARLVRGGLKRRGTGRGGKPDREYSLCKFYMQGKCQRGSECPFSHNAMPPRKLEVCKFYMMDCCAKKDKCLYMHNEFPCKYFHTGLKCYAGKRCKFSHGKLSPQLKNALFKYLETAPKDMLGDFPNRHNRDNMGERGPREMVRYDGPRDDGMGRDHRGGSEGRSDVMRDGRGRGRDEECHTPMPSPSQDNSDRDQEFMEPDMRPRRSPKRREHKDSGSGEEFQTDTIPLHLPKKQRELFLRIQQQQRKADTSQDCEDEDHREEENNFKEENWYSSDDESSNNPLNTILQSLGQPGLRKSAKEAPPPSAVPPVLPDIDVNAVSKLLSTVRETIQQKTESANDICPPGEEKLPPVIPKPHEEKRSRDPRLRGAAAAQESCSTSANIEPPVHHVGPHVPLDLDLRGLGGSNTISSVSGGAGADVDLRHLPFKPAPPHQAAKEIDGSLASHPPIEYKLIPIPVVKPDYSTVKPHAKAVSDPRLRRYHAPQQQDFVARDPRNRAPLAADPRRKSMLLNSQPSGGNTGGMGGRFEEIGQQQQQGQGMSSPPGVMSRDCDLRFPPPSPNIDDPRRPPMQIAPPPPTHPVVPMPPQPHPMPLPHQLPTYIPPHPTFVPRHTDIDLRVQAHSHFSYK